MNKTGIEVLKKELARVTEDARIKLAENTSAKALVEQTREEYVRLCERKQELEFSIAMLEGTTIESPAIMKDNRHA